MNPIASMGPLPAQLHGSVVGPGTGIMIPPHQPIGGMTGMAPRDNMMGMPPPPPPYGKGVHQGIQQGMQPQPQPHQSLKVRTTSIVRDKAKLIGMEENSAKRFIMEPLRATIEENNLATTA